MNRWLILLCLLSLLLCSCQLREEQIDYLSALRQPFEASGRAVINGKTYDLSLKSDSGQLTISMKTTSGLDLVFRSIGSGILLSSDGKDAELPVNDAQSGIPALFSLFSLSRADLISTSKQEAGEEDLLVSVFQTEQGAVTLTILKRTKIPTKLEGDFPNANVVLHLTDYTPLNA